MFTPISPTGRVTADLELQSSANGTSYVQFFLAVNKGYGEHQHPNFFQCILFGKSAERCMKAGVKKGSLLSVTGDFDLVEYTRKSDGTKGTIAKISVYDWNYIPTGRKTEDAETEPEAADTGDGFMDVEDCGENGLPFD